MMKKILFLIALISLITLNGCDKNEALDAISPKTCFELCHQHIPEICPEYFLELDDYTFENCEKDCAKFWNDVTISCISDATTCEQLSYDEPYCTEDAEEGFEMEKAPEEKSACDTACANYAICAGYADDATEMDKVEAYETCYGECQHWSEETIRCTSKRINSAMDCATLSMCGLKEYKGQFGL